MMRETVIFAGAGITVTATRLSTPRQTVMLRDIDHIGCRRPFLLVLLPVAVGSVLMALRFADLLTLQELAAFIVPPLVVTALAAEIGVLRLTSLSLRDQAVWGKYRELQKARAAIEQALEAGRLPQDRRRPAPVSETRSDQGEG